MSHPVLWHTRPTTLDEKVGWGQGYSYYISLNLELSTRNVQLLLQVECLSTKGDIQYHEVKSHKSVKQTWRYMTNHTEMMIWDER